jgi:AcrR family transcriptional regulator/RimJ/RimL family protein N-acetyltransferase
VTRGGRLISATRGLPAASVVGVTTDEELRRRIIDAAAELFAQHGYEGVGVRQVAQEAGVSQYKVRQLTGGRAELFAAVMAEKVSSDAAEQIARAVEAPNEVPPLAAIVAAGAAVFASPDRSWDLLELEALTRAHRDQDLRRIESQRIQDRWDNMRTVVERVGAAGGLDPDVDDDAVTHFAVAMSAGLALIDPVITHKPTQRDWDALMARIGVAMAPAGMLLEAEHEARSHWRIFIDVPDRPGGVDRFIRAMATVHAYTLGVYVVGSGDGRRTLFMSLTAPGSVTEGTLTAAAMSAGRDVRIAPGSEKDALDLTSVVLDSSTELVTNPGWAPYMAMQLVAAEHVEVVRATKGEDDGPDVLRLQWTPDRHVLLRRTWAPFTRVEQTRASALLRLSAAIAVASGDSDAQGWVEPVKAGTVWIRLAHPEDADAVAAMHRRCSDRTLYLRYVSSGDWHEIQMRRLSGGHSGATLVAVGDDGQVIGLGNVFPERPDDNNSAEIAVLVEDSHQGEGIGTALLRRQLRIAERLGFAEVVAVVLTENSAVTRMLERTGLTWTTRIEEGTSTMRARLRGAESQPQGPAGD